MPESTQPEPVAGFPISDDPWRTEVALCRYTLILPLLRHDRHRDGPKHALRTAIARERHTIPHSRRHTVSPPTLRRWEAAWRRGGFEALKPKARQDRRAPRTLSPETLDRAEALKRELPTRSARTIIEILKRDQAQPVPAARIAPRTLRRHLATRGATTRRLLKGDTVFRRFERTHFGDLWQSAGLARGRLSPQSPRRNRPDAPGPLPPGPGAVGPPGGPPGAAGRLSLPRLPQGHQDRRTQPPRQPLPRPRLPGRPDRGSALRPLRPPVLEIWFKGQ